MKLSLMNLDDIKNQVVKFIVKDMILNQEIQESQRIEKEKELALRIQSSEIVTQLRPQEGVTNSLTFNAVNQELYLDLLTLFKYINEVEKSISKHTELNLSSIRTLQNQLADLEDHVESLERTLANRNLTYFHVENFNNSNTASTEVEDYTERYGETVTLSSHAFMNTQENALMLPYLRQHNMMTYSDSVSVGEVKLRKQVCEAFSYAQTYAKDLERLIDTSSQTFWSESLFVEEPITLQFSSVPDEGLENFYYGIGRGALFELEFHFESVVRINELALNPYIQYPLELVAIRYSSSDELEDSVFEVVSPTQDNPLYQSQMMDGSLSLRFPDINCKHLFLVFNQKHYVKESFLLNSLDLFKNHLWDQLHKRDYQYNSISPQLLFKPVYLDQERRLPEVRYLNELKGLNQPIDLHKFLLSGPDYARVMTKYHYQYGFYNIAPNFVEFEETGIFTSKPIQVSGNIKAIQLEVDQLLGSSSSQCLSDVEYYVSCSLDQFNDWQAILPRNLSRVECERLQSGVDYCELRFPATQLLSVKYEQESLVEGVDFEAVKNGETIVGLDMPNFKESGMYTVAYVPHESAREINLVQQDVPILFNKLETIKGNNRSYYELEEFPYLSELEMTNVKLINKENGIVMTQENQDLDCVTDLLDAANSFKRFNLASSRFQYYIYKNHLYFNHPIPLHYDIEINYQHFISSFKIKLILRKNTKDEGWITPIVRQLKAEILMLD